jgi:hypothetical protein
MGSMVRKWWRFARTGCTLKDGWRSRQSQWRRTGCLSPASRQHGGAKHTGIGCGRHKPSSALVDAVFAGFQAVEIGVANGQALLNS